MTANTRHAMHSAVLWAAFALILAICINGCAITIGWPS